TGAQAGRLPLAPLVNQHAPAEVPDRPAPPGREGKMSHLAASLPEERPLAPHSAGPRPRLRGKSSDCLGPSYSGFFTSTRATHPVGPCLGVVGIGVVVRMALGTMSLLGVERGYASAPQDILAGGDSL